MGSGYHAMALFARIGQFLLLAQILLIALAHPHGNHLHTHLHGNHSISLDGKEDSLFPVVRRASIAEFKGLSKHNKILVHNSCTGTGKRSMEQWQNMINDVVTITKYAQKIAKVTNQIITYHVGKDQIPTLNSDNRRIMDEFMAFYGTFSWTDGAAKTRAQARAQRLQEMTNIFADKLAQNLLSWRFICDNTEWVDAPMANPADKAWMIKDMTSYTPIVKKLTSDICIMPLEGGGTGPVSAVTTVGNGEDPVADWVQFCDGAFDVDFAGRALDWVNENKRQDARQRQLWLEYMIKNTPERLIIHEMTHGTGAFGNSRTKDFAYGWEKIAALAQNQQNLDEANVDKHKPLKNADTFAYWAVAVYFQFCNFRNGGCQSPTQLNA